LPATVTCASFNPTSVTPSGNAVSTTLTITTAAATASFAPPARPNSNPAAPTLLASLGGLGVFGLLLAGSNRKRNRRKAILLGIMFLVMTFTLLGCGGGNSNTGLIQGGTPAGNYTIAVTATGTGTGSPTHSMNVTLVVQ
jgi:succinate-acetate transporter protein